MIAALFLAAAVNLSWQNPCPARVASYKVHVGTRSILAGNPPSTILPTTSPNYQVSNLSDATTYFFCVTASDGKGYESPYSNEVSVTTAKPSPTPSPAPTKTPTPTPTPTPVPTPTPLPFSLAWNPVPYATSYRIFENNVQIAEIPGLTYPLTGKVGPKTYTIRAVGAMGTSSASNAVTFPASSSTPAAPVLQLK